MVTAKDFRILTGIKITEKHNDKMAGLWSISTAPSCNKYCIARLSNPDMICAHCYSVTMNKRFKNLRKMLENNADILTTKILTIGEMPIIESPSGYFRFEAFGDLINEIQVVNYFAIASANPEIKCALWTKNPWIIASAIKTYGIVKPANLRIIGSSYYINKPMDNIYKKYDFIDNIFTVYSADYVKANNINITCGARSCANCGRCYRGDHTSYEINELLK